MIDRHGHHLTSRRPLLLACLAALVAGCGAGDDVERGPYVSANLALLDTLPAVPGARVIGTSSSAYRDGDNPGARTAGYGTSREYRLPRGTSGAAAVDHYRRALTPAWTEVAGSREYVSLRRGDAYLHVLAGRGRLSAEIDADCYKSDSSPHCFGP